MQLVTTGDFGGMQTKKRHTIFYISPKISKKFRKTHTYTSRYYFKKAVITRVWDPDVKGIRDFVC